MLLLRVIDIAFQIYFLMLLARIIASWVPNLMNNAFFVWIAAYTDPYLNWFRTWIPPIGVLDLSPVVAFFALAVLRRVLVQLLLFFI